MFCNVRDGDAEWLFRVSWSHSGKPTVRLRHHAIVEPSGRRVLWSADLPVDECPMRREDVPLPASVLEHMARLVAQRIEADILAVAHEPWDGYGEDESMI